MMSVPFSAVSRQELSKMVDADKCCEWFISTCVDLQNFQLGQFNSPTTKEDIKQGLHANFNGIFVEDAEELLQDLYMVTLGRESVISRRMPSPLNRESNDDNKKESLQASDMSDLDEFYYAKFKPFKYAKNQAKIELPQ